MHGQQNKKNPTSVFHAENHAFNFIWSVNCLEFLILVAGRAYVCVCVCVYIYIYIHVSNIDFKTRL